MSKLKNVTVEINGLYREFEGVNLDVEDKDDFEAVHATVLEAVVTHDYEFGGLESATIRVEYRIQGEVEVELDSDELVDYNDESELEYAVEMDPETFGVYDAIQNDLDYSGINSDAIFNIEVDVEAE